MPTFNQLIHHGREEKWHTDCTRALDQCPQNQGVCPHVSTRSPKKPNSALRKIVKVQLSNRHDIFAHILGEGHNLQEHPIVLVRGGRVKDSSGVKSHCIRVSRICWELRIVEGADLNMVQKHPNQNKWKMPLEHLLVEGELSSIALFNAMEALASPEYGFPASKLPSRFARASLLSFQAVAI